MLDQLSEQARTLLEGQHFAVLATLNEDGSLHQSVMWYMLEKYNDVDIILMNTKRGRVKERNMRHNPHVSVCIEDEYSYVTVSGTVELIDDHDIAQSTISQVGIIRITEGNVFAESNSPALTALSGVARKSVLSFRASLYTGERWDDA